MLSKNAMGQYVRGTLRSLTKAASFPAGLLSTLIPDAVRAERVEERVLGLFQSTSLFQSSQRNAGHEAGEARLPADPSCHLRRSVGPDGARLTPVQRGSRPVSVQTGDLSSPFDAAAAEFTRIEFTRARRSSRPPAARASERPSARPARQSTRPSARPSARASRAPAAADDEMQPILSTLSSSTLRESTSRARRRQRKGSRNKRR